MRYRNVVVVCLTVVSLGHVRLSAAEFVLERGNGLVYFHEAQLAMSRATIASRDPVLLAAYNQLLAESDTLLEMDPDPVVNKSIVPPSGDLHDYLSHPPYRWPDETKNDGLPWKVRDGERNPTSLGPETDRLRLRNFTSAVETLSFAYYFSGDKKYSDKALELLQVWFISPDTRIATQLRPNGQQPLELGRTRSIHYSATNLWALTKLTFMGRKLGVDLWAFESEGGSSLPGAYRYLEPFARLEKPWPFKEISPGGVEAAVHAYMRPLFRNASVLLNLDGFEWSMEEKIERTPLEMLQYPVLKKLTPTR